MTNLPDIIDELRVACTAAGGVEAWANRHRIYSLLVIRVLQGDVEPSPAILGALGYQSRVTYHRGTV